MKTHPLDDEIDLGMVGAYNERATNTQLSNHIVAMGNLAAINDTRIDTICVYSLTEYYENGKVIAPTKLSNGTINRGVVDIFKAILNP